MQSHALPQRTSSSYMAKPVPHDISSAKSGFEDNSRVLPPSCPASPTYSAFEEVTLPSTLDPSHTSAAAVSSATDHITTCLPACSGQSGVYEAHSPLPSSPDPPRTSAAAAATTPPDPSAPYLGELSRNGSATGLAVYLGRRCSDVNVISNVNIIPKTHPLAAFQSAQVPAISLPDFMRRIVSYVHCSPSALVIALLYVERLLNCTSQVLRLTEFTVHRIYITALVLAVKMLDDRVFSASHYARVGGIPSVTELTRMELTFMHFIEFRLHVVHAPYDNMLKTIIRSCDNATINVHSQIESEIDDAFSMVTSASNNSLSDSSTSTFNSGINLSVPYHRCHSIANESPQSITSTKANVGSKRRQQRIRADNISRKVPKRTYKKAKTGIKAKCSQEKRKSKANDMVCNGGGTP